MKLFQLKSIMIRKNDFWKTPLNMFMFTPTNFNFDSWLYFSIHPIFIFITCCMFYIIASTVKVILKPILFPLNLYQTFFLPVIFSVHLKVSFVHLFTGVIYFKSIIVSRAFKCRLFFIPLHYIYHKTFFMKKFYGHWNAFFFKRVFLARIKY
jgi:hypothetical protein